MFWMFRHHTHTEIYLLHDWTSFWGEFKSTYTRIYLKRCAALYIFFKRSFDGDGGKIVLYMSHSTMFPFVYINGRMSWSSNLPKNTYIWVSQQWVCFLVGNTLQNVFFCLLQNLGERLASTPQSVHFINKLLFLFVLKEVCLYIIYIYILHVALVLRG